MNGPMGIGSYGPYGNGSIVVDPPRHRFFSTLSEPGMDCNQACNAHGASCSNTDMAGWSDVRIKEEFTVKIVSKIKLIV